METHTNPEFESTPFIDTARSGDSASIAAVQKAGWLATYPDPSVGLTREEIEGKDFDSPEKLRSWEETIEKQNESKHIWVAREDDTIVGFAVGEKTPECHELKAIYVLPSHHGKNIGKSLMNAALEWLGNERDTVVWVFTHNKRAIAFYKKSGFEQSGKTSSFDINGKQIPDLEMVKRAGN